MLLGWDIIPATIELGVSSGLLLWYHCVDTRRERRSSLGLRLNEDEDDVDEGNLYDDENRRTQDEGNDEDLEASPSKSTSWFGWSSTSTSSSSSSSSSSNSTAARSDKGRDDRSEQLWMAEGAAVYSQLAVQTSGAGDDAEANGQPMPVGTFDISCSFNVIAISLAFAPLAPLMMKSQIFTLLNCVSLSLCVCMCVCVHTPA
jgi:hypothetical protein